MTASAPLVRALVQGVERAGVPRAVFLVGARLSEERLADETVRFDLEEVDRFYTLALDLTANEAFGLELAERVTDAAFDLVAHLISHAPTLRDAFTLTSQFGPILLTDGAVTLSEKVDVARVTIRLAPMSTRAHRLHMDFLAAGMLRLMQLFVPPTAPIHGVSFEFAAPPEQGEYTRIFGVAARFGSDTTFIEFPRAWLERRALHRSDRLFTLLHDEARRRLDSMDSGPSFGQRVERYLLSFPASKMPNLEQAARELGTSGRSLRRYLAAEGTSYRVFVNRALERASTEMLRNSKTSVEETATLTGYAQPTAFNRAFKRWTGVTPAKFRRTNSQ